MFHIRNIILFILALFTLISCKKIPPVNTTDGDLLLKLNYKIDGQPLKFDERIYTNAAGNNYEVTRLNFYISNVVFYSAQGDFKCTKIFYCDAKNAETSWLQVENLPKGIYDSIGFHIGLDTSQNHSYGLPNNDDNINMAWPDPMGGGYHFLKLEGNYSYNSSSSGFAMHLGRDTSLVNCSVKSKFVFGVYPFELKLSMNVNEWFVNPHLFNFDTEGNYIMGNNSAMRKIAENGVDVFTLEK